MTNLRTCEKAIWSEGHMWSSAQLIRTPSTQGVDGVKACQAVRAGIERGLYQALQAPPPPAAGPAGPASSNHGTCAERSACRPRRNASNVSCK
jgi:hypothetical protein